jgi:hypothetical protein
MKVKLATQLLSRSVAKAIEFCRDDLKMPLFRNSEATCKLELFIGLFIELFIFIQKLEFII